MKIRFTTWLGADPLLKPLSKILEQDTRYSSAVLTDPMTGDLRSATIEDHYLAISEVELNTSVPDQIRAVFERARNVFLYSWFVYELASVAESQGYIALELALTERLPPAPGFKPLGIGEKLRIALERGMFVTLPLRDGSDGGAHFKRTFSTIRQFRNQLAHGDQRTTTPGAALDALGTCAALINCLYGS